MTEDDWENWVKSMCIAFGVEYMHGQSGASWYQQPTNDSHLVLNSFKNLYLQVDTVTLTYNLWPWPCDLWPFNLVMLTMESSLKIEMLHFDLDLQPLTLTSVTLTLTLFPDTKLKTGIFTFLTLVALTFDLWPCPTYVSPWCVCWILGLYVHRFSLQTVNRRKHTHILFISFMG